MAHQEQKCPACGAPLRFDAALGLLVCDYCGTQTRLEARPAPAPQQGQPGKPGKPGQNQAGDPIQYEGFDFSTLNDQAVQCDAASLPVYNCVSCGAELICAPQQVALTCPYCGNHIVRTDQLSGALRPNGIIPFRITPSQLPAAVQRYYSGKKLLPKGFFSESAIGPVTGVYVPFWVFDGELEGHYTFSGTTASSRRRGDYIITDTKYYDLLRDARVCFRSLPVAAASTVENKLMDALEPYAMEDAVPFDPGYLAGFTAERFDLKKEGIAQRARQRMRNTTDDLVLSQSTGGFSNVHQKKGRVRASLDAKYILFPIYLFHVEFRGKRYPFCVNGQTGRVVGDLPVDEKQSRRFFLLRFGLAAGALMLRSIVAYFMGV